MLYEKDDYPSTEAPESNPRNPIFPYEKDNKPGAKHRTACALDVFFFCFLRLCTAMKQTEIRTSVCKTHLPLALKHVPRAGAR